MAEAFLLTVGTVLALLGLSEFVHIIISAVLRPKAPVKNYLITVLSAEAPEQQLMFNIQQLHWYGKKYAGKLIAVTDGLSVESENLCCSRFKGDAVVFTKKDNIGKIVKEL